MTEIVCLSWSCSLACLMVSRSFAFIDCIYWRFRQSANYVSKIAIYPQRASVIVTDVEHHTKTHIDSVRSFNVYKRSLPRASVFSSFSVGSGIYVVSLAENLFQFTFISSSCRVLAVGFLIGAWKTLRPRDHVHHGWCHPVTHGAHFAKQHQRVYDLVLKSNCCSLGQSVTKARM